MPSAGPGGADAGHQEQECLANELPLSSREIRKLEAAYESNEAEFVAVFHTATLHNPRSRSMTCFGSDCYSEKPRGFRWMQKRAVQVVQADGAAPVR